MGKAALIGIVAVVLIAGLAVMGTYNRLVSLAQAVDAQWSQVENVYQRRADLVPNLVATVKGAASFERGTLEAVTAARASVGRVQISGKDLVNDPEAFARWQKAQDALGSALTRLLAVAEQYPQLTATQAFRDLQSQLEGTENRISVERMPFVQAAKEYNTARLSFPANLLAGGFGFAEKAYFTAQPGAAQAPAVSFESETSPAPAR